MKMKRLIRGMALAVLALQAACAGDSGNGDRGLTADQSAALLGEIRARPSRAEKLTPEEMKAVLRSLNSGK